MAVHACTITLAESLKSLSHFMCVCVCVYSGAGLVAKSCPILATPWTVAHQAPLTLGFPKREYWSGLPFPSPGDVPSLGIKLVSLESPALAGRILYHCVTWEACVSCILRVVKV